MLPDYRYIECEGITIAVAIDTKSQLEHNIYHPINGLYYIKRGKMHVRSGQQLATFEKNSFLLIKKFTNAIAYKSWDPEEDGAKVYVFGLEDSFIQSAMDELNFTISDKKVNLQTPKYLAIKKNQILLGFFDSLACYIEEYTELDREFIQLKTKEALMGILRYHPEHIPYFLQVSQPEKADLPEFMEHNFTHNLPLKELARLSGRSLSKFNRDFRAVFNDTPHQWILDKRLLRAEELIKTTQKKISEIYLELGFEDLGHFSRTFKKYFGKSPSELRKSIV